MPDLPNGWRLKSTDRVYSNYYIEIYEDRLDLNGTEKLYIRAKRKDYSTIIPFISRERILLIKSYRHLINSIELEAPSGYIDEGETAEEAAKRELKEETGYSTNKIISLGNYTLDYSMFEQLGHLFVAFDLSKEGEQKLGMMEKIDIQIMGIDEVRKLLSEGKIKNAASIVALYKAFDYIQSIE